MAGRQLVQSALRLRAYALLSRTQLYARILLPGVRFSYGKLAGNYQHLSGLRHSLECSIPLSHSAFRASLICAMLIFIPRH